MAVKTKKKTAKKTVKKPAKKTAKKPVIKPVKKAAKKTVEKSVKKAAQKKVKMTKKPVKSIPVKTKAKPSIQSTVDPNAPGMSKASCDVVEMGGNSFVVVVNRARNFFTLDEMKIMVRICHAAGNENEGAERLFKWLKNYRSDVLRDTDINFSMDTALLSIYKYLVNHYSVKE
ncbi:MAG TPA: hypothetical protein PKK43_05715 [Spirochaetota bacterium]|nr:hypothetical protein [Spirochaetota bacterium]